MSDYFGHIFLTEILTQLSCLNYPEPRSIKIIDYVSFLTVSEFLDNCLFFDVFIQ